MAFKTLKTLQTAAVAAIASGAAAAAPVIDGAIDSADGWTSAFTDNGVEVFVASDINNLYFAGATPDDDDGSAPPASPGPDDIFNINFGLDGNAAAWRYRVLSENKPFTDNGGSSTTFDGVWQGFLQGGDDSVVANAAFGVPGGLTNLDATQVDYAVSATNGTREHEFAIPWALLLDGNNGWESGQIDLRIGGFYAEDGGGFTGLGIQSGGGIDFGDQSTYALVRDVPAAVPLPAPALLLVAGLGALGAARRLRA